MSRSTKPTAPADARRARTACLLAAAGVVVLLLNLAASLALGQVMTGLALWGVGLLVGAALVLELPADPALTDDQEH